MYRYMYLLICINFLSSSNKEDMIENLADVFCNVRESVHIVNHVIWDVFCKVRDVGHGCRCCVCDVGGA